MPDYRITADNNQQLFKDAQNINSVVTYSFDFSSWAQDNNDVTTVTWTVKSGQAGVSGEALASNLASAQITLNQAGGSLIQIKAETGTETYVTYIDILTRDPNRILVNDYGLCEC